MIIKGGLIGMFRGWIGSLKQRFGLGDSGPKKKIATKKEEVFATKKLVCNHGPTDHAFTIEVLGVKCGFRKSPYCMKCTEEYLNVYSAKCNSCRKPIVPGTKVGSAGVGAEFPFVHLYLDCCESGALFCGKWGEGELISLNELHPDKYPEGTETVLGHSYDTSSVTTQELESRR